MTLLRSYSYKMIHSPILLEPFLTSKLFSFSSFTCLFIVTLDIPKVVTTQPLTVDLSKSGFFILKK
jgi:hypothetical protein